VHALFPCGTTGEGLLMTIQERKQFLETVVRAAGKRVKVIAHAGCLDTASAVDLTRHAAEAGAVAAAVVTPGFYAYDDAALFRHFKTVAQAAPSLPIFLYNIPGCARNLLSPDLIIALAQEVDNIVGLKDSGGNICNLTAVLNRAPKGFTVFNGVDEYSFQALLSGANGSVSSTANVVPELFLGVFNAVKRGDLQKGRATQMKLDIACKLFQYGRMVAYYKEGLRLRGFDPGYVRPPQRELTAAERKAFAHALEESGLI
jgi:dihydrodipicolinate synthase/N-acetylneuraminate lyase